MNQPYARVNQPYATLTLASALREMFGVQLYKNNARTLLSRILSILNLDWLQHVPSVRGVYECSLSAMVLNLNVMSNVMSSRFNKPMYDQSMWCSSVLIWGGVILKSSKKQFYTVPALLILVQ